MNNLNPYWKPRRWPKKEKHFLTRNTSLNRNLVLIHSTILKTIIAIIENGEVTLHIKITITKEDNLVAQINIRVIIKRHLNQKIGSLKLKINQLKLHVIHVEKKAISLLIAIRDSLIKMRKI